MLVSSYGRFKHLEHEEEVAPWIVDVEADIPGAAASLGACVNPVARDSGFVLYPDSSSSGGMQSFTFNTSQKEATKAVESTSAPAMPPPPVTTQALPVVPIATAAPTSSEAPSALPPPAPAAPPPTPVSATTQKQTDVNQPEHVSPPTLLHPMLPAAEGADLATKGYVRHISGSRASRRLN